jgi:hypothetical protein
MLAGEGEQVTQFFPGDPDGEQLAGLHLGGDLGPHPRLGLIRQALAAALRPTTICCPAHS